MGPPWGAFCQITLTFCYISTSPKRKLRNNNDITDYSAGDKYVSRPESAAVKDIDIADILGSQISISASWYQPTSSLQSEGW